MSQNSNVLQLGTGGQFEEPRRRVHLFNRGFFILGVFGLPMVLLLAAAVWSHIQGSLPWTIVFTSCSCAIGGFLHQRLQRSVELQIDEYKTAAEASTSEVAEKYGLLSEGYRNFLAYMRLPVSEIRNAVRRRAPAASTREVERLVQDEIEKRLKDRYATVLPWWPFTYDNGPTSSLKLAATRYYRAIESLKRLEPSIQRRDRLEEEILQGRASRQTIKEKEQLDGIINQTLMRVNGEIREIPPVAPQVVTWHYGWVIIISFLPFAFFLWMCAFIIMR